MATQCIMGNGTCKGALLSGCLGQSVVGSPRQFNASECPYSFAPSLRFRCPPPSGVAPAFACLLGTGGGGSLQAVVM